jgi:hypothetical protein
MTRVSAALAAIAATLALLGAGPAPAVDAGASADARPVKSYFYGFPPRPAAASTRLLAPAPDQAVRAGE